MNWKWTWKRWTWKPKLRGFQIKVLQMNWKISNLNLNRRLPGLRNPKSLWGSQWPSGQNLNKSSDKHLVSYPVPSMIAQSCLWDSQIWDKKNDRISFNLCSFFITCVCYYYIFHQRNLYFINWALGPNLITRFSVTFRPNTIRTMIDIK